MRLEPGRFDRVLKEVYTGERECGCHRHLPFRAIPLTPSELLKELGTPEWSGVQAMRTLGVTYTLDPQLSTADRPGAQVRDKRSYVAFRADGHPASMAGALIAENVVYINPVAPTPLRTLIHELCHRELGHARILGTGVPGFIVDIMEAQVENAVILVLDALGLDALLPTSRGYVANYCEVPLPRFLQEEAKVAATHILSAGMVTAL